MKQKSIKDVIIIIKQHFHFVIKREEENKSKRSEIDQSICLFDDDTYMNENMDEYGEEM